MKNSYLTKIHGTGFSSGVSTERKLKFVATIILLACILVLVATKGLQEFSNFLLK